MTTLQLTPDEGRQVRLALLVRVEQYDPYGGRPQVPEHKEHADALRTVVARLPIG